MIEANNPEINVDELMQQIKLEVAQRQINFRPVSTVSDESLLKHTTIIKHIEALLTNAESRASVREQLPNKFNRFPLSLVKGLQKIALKVLKVIFTDQREVNYNLINAFKQSIILNQELIGQVISLRSQLDERLNNVSSSVQDINQHLSAISNHSQVLEQRINVANNDITAISNHSQALEQRINITNNDITAISNHSQALEQRINVVNNNLTGVNNHVQALDDRYQRNDSYVKIDLLHQKRLFTLFLEEARKRLPEPFNQEQLETIVNEEQHLLDAFYVAFEDQFRGSQELVLNRLKVYLPLLASSKVGTPEAPILDVGCGRGEWLELLRESGYTAKGLDLNRVMLDYCQVKNLEVIESDAVTYLQSLPDASLGAITGFHIIEHLEFSRLIKLLNEAIRVLQSGGVAIFETPNPQNVFVGANNFYIDPTHRNPLPSPLTKFLLENTGFAKVEIKNLNPYDESFKINGSEIAQRFNEYFYGPQDYAVIGYKI